jgi:hypothetical protein
MTAFSRKRIALSLITANFRLRPKAFMVECLRNIFHMITEQKEEKHSEIKATDRLEIISNGTTAMACASGGALLGTTFAGHVGGVVIAVASGIAGFLISGSHSVAPHDK